MATIEAFKAEFLRIDQATTAIAKELLDLREQLKGQGLSPEIEDEILGLLKASADKLEGIGKPLAEEVIPQA